MFNERWDGNLAFGLMKLKNIMELTRPNYAVVYVILLCALAQGGSEGKGGKEDGFSRDGGGASFIYVHRLKVSFFL